MGKNLEYRHLEYIEMKKVHPILEAKQTDYKNYDDLYADVLKWVNNGWIDYCVPQIYWEIGNKAADYKELITWWNRYASNRPLYIGEDVLRTVKAADPQNPNSHQLPAKHKITRTIFKCSRNSFMVCGCCSK